MASLSWSAIRGLMVLVGLLGADGVVGRSVASVLRDRDHGLRAVDRGDLGAALSGGHEGAVDVLAIAGCPLEVATHATAAAVAAGVPVVDATPAQHHVRGLLDRVAEAALDHEVAVVPAAGWLFSLGGLLGAVATTAAGDTDEVHVAYALPERRDLVRGWTRGARAAAVESLAGPGVALDHGRLSEELAGEARRLAWFPRPVGPHHAAGIPGAEALLLPRSRPGPGTVRTYAALPSLGAEALQAGARSLQRGAGWPRRLLGRLPEPDGRRRAALRWACVAEASSAAGTVRAWAYGSDPYALTAQAMVLWAERVVSPTAPAGVVGPAELDDPSELLDELTLRAGARWSLSRPS